MCCWVCCFVCVYVGTIVVDFSCLYLQEVSMLCSCVCTTTCSSPSTFQSACTNTSPQPEFESEVLPITSYQCQWKRPSKSKESNLQIIEASFEKPVYGRIRKYSFESLADYDPHPIEFRGTANDNLKIFLGKVHGKALGVSLLLDSSCRCWSTNSEESLAPELPSKSELKYRVQE